MSGFVVITICIERGLRITLRRRLPVLALLATTALSSIGVHAETLSQDLVFGASGQSIWQGGSGGSLSYDGLLGPSWSNLGGSVGGVKCRWYGCYGAELSLNTSGNAGLGYSVQLGAGSMTITFPEKITIATPDVGTIASGQSFTIQATVTPATSITLASGAIAAANLQTVGPTLAASLALQAQLNLTANARGCIAGCIRGSVSVSPGFNQSLLAIDSTQGTLTVLGNTVGQTNGTFSYTVPGGIASVTAKVPVLNTDSSQGGGWSGTALASTVRSNVLGVNVSLDKALSSLTGLPPLSGSFGPVGYSILTANAGATLDVQQNFSFVPNLQAALGFTAPVSMQQADGTFGAASNSANLTLASGLNTFTFQAPGVTSLGVNPVFTLNNTTSNTTSLLVAGSIAVSAGSVSAFGKTVGPLFSTTQDLGTLPPISLYSNNFAVNIPSITANPFNIGFGAAKTGLQALAFQGLKAASDTSEDYLVVGSATGQGSLYEVADLNTLVATGKLLVGSATSPTGTCAAADGLGSGTDGIELLCTPDGSAIKPYLASLPGVLYVGDTNASTQDASGTTVFYDSPATLVAPIDNLIIAENTTAMDTAELTALGVTGTVAPDVAPDGEALPLMDIPSTEILPDRASDPDQPVPEPGTVGLVLLATAAMAWTRRRAGRRS